MYQPKLPKCIRYYKNIDHIIPMYPNYYHLYDTNIYTVSYKIHKVSNV